eukprot:7650026-Prorocentrum_lima.AAC.1
MCGNHATRGLRSHVARSPRHVCRRHTQRRFFTGKTTVFASARHAMPRSSRRLLLGARLV